MHNAGLRPVADDFSNFAEWLALIFQQYTRDETLTSVMLCWMVWKSRNELVWNQHSVEVHEVVESAKSVSVQDTSFVNILGFLNPEDGYEHWRRPTENRVKVNVDAAIFASSNRFTFALVARNENGDLVEAMSSCEIRQNCS